MKIIQKIALGTAIFGTGAVTPIVVSAITNKGTNSVFFQNRRTLIQHMELASFAGDTQRTWDMSVQAKNMVSREYYDGITPMLFRQRTIQSSLVVDDINGDPQLKQQKKEEYKFDAISSVEISGNSTVYKDYKSLANDLKPSSGKTTKNFTFKIKSGTKYIDNQGQETKYEFKAIDFFYGFMRGIYTIDEVRQKGTINGLNKINPLSSVYGTKVKNDSEFYPGGQLDSNFDSRNGYLNNLYGVDLAGTIAANTGANFDEDKFELKFTIPQNSLIIENFLSNSNAFTPVSSQKIRELNNNELDMVNKPGFFLQLLEYGKSPRNGYEVDLSGELLISRFYMNQFSTDPNSTGIILIKNGKSYDEEWNNNDKTLNKLQYLILDANDRDTMLQNRQKSFLIDNSESLLYTAVQENPYLMNEINRRLLYTEREESTAGVVKHSVFNPWFMLNSGNSSMVLDDNTSKLLFGKKREEAKTDKDADDEYFLGRGRQFRTLLNASINLFGLSQEFSPGSSAVKTTKDYFPGQIVTGGTNDTLGSEWKSGKRTAISHGLTDDLDQANWYNANQKSYSEFLKPTGDKYAVMQKAWKDFISSSRSTLSMTQNDNFVFPIYDYRAIDLVESQTIKRTYTRVVEYLNTLTKGSGMQFKEFIPTASKEQNLVNKFETAPTVYRGTGADYGSIISIVQQDLSASYGFAVLPMIIREALENNNKIKVFDETNQDDFNLSATFDISDLINWIKGKQTKYDVALNKTFLDKVTMQQWIAYRNGEASIDPDVDKVFEQLDDAAQQYFYLNNGNKAIVEGYTELASSLSLLNKISIGYKPNSALGPKPDAKMSTKRIYASPWLHLADMPSRLIGLINVIDTYVDMEGE